MSHIKISKEEEAKFIKVNLSDIRDVKYAELDDNKLYELENPDFLNFEYHLNNSKPEHAIRLKGTHPPYDIENGMHRIFLARIKGWNRVKAYFTNDIVPRH